MRQSFIRPLAALFAITAVNVLWAATLSMTAV